MLTAGLSFDSTERNAAQNEGRRSSTSAGNERSRMPCYFRLSALSVEHEKKRKQFIAIRKNMG
jgi:hypothetical protein